MGREKVWTLKCYIAAINIKILVNFSHTPLNPSIRIQFIPILRVVYFLAPWNAVV